MTFTVIAEIPITFSKSRFFLLQAVQKYKGALDSTLLETESASKGN